ncbi:MAG: hypothetical protein PHT76_02415 [Anaerostipes sp.]|nr:hypothetical protein [Anaerostipes sp.]
MELFLTLVSGLAWTIVYIACIRIGFKQKTYGIPLFALGLNIAWEVIYAVQGLANPSIQTPVNFIWAGCDLVIVYTYFKYGRKHFPENAKAYFTPFSILSFATCIALQLAFFFRFEWLEAAQYSAFAQNVTMSILFLVMLYRRNSSEGQSMIIAVAKWLGTLAPTLLMGIYREFNVYIVMTGIICSVWDLLYIYLLNKKIQEEKNVVLK